MHWWVIIPVAGVAVISLYGLFRWASKDTRVDAEIERQHFRADQDWRGLHRSPIDAPDRDR